MIVEVSLNRDFKDIPDVSKVQARIKINDVIIDWLSFEIVSTNTHAADTFTIEAPLYDQSNKDMNIILDTEALKIEIAVDDGSGSFVRILFGYADSEDTDLVFGLVTIVGRDLTSLLMDKKALRSKVIANLTSSELASDYADEHDLKKDITPTLLRIGSYDGYQHVTTTGSQSEWDVLCKLAQNEGFEVYVIDDTLYFKPPTTTKDYYKINWDYVAENGFESSNALKIRVHRNYTIANDIKVHVKGHNSYDGKSYSQTISRKHTPQRVKGRASKTQTYEIYADGADQDRITRIAEAASLQLSQHEKKLTLELMGDTILTPRSIIKLTGVGKRFDQLYYPDSVTRHMSFGETFKMDATAKNHNVNSQVT